MNVCEIFESLQGESSYSGLPCIFIRLSECNLRCGWCDTKYAYGKGKEYSINEIAEKINSSNCRLVEITGGEPLLQKEGVTELVKLIEENRTVLIETNGTISLEDLPERIIRIVDIKLRGSGHGGSFLESNISFLRKIDEIKFVISDFFDYNQMMEYYTKFGLGEICGVLISKTEGSGLTDKEIAESILRDGINARYQIQLHKHIWKDEKGR